jgi:outer membrane biosynthesis protein TonB
VLVPRQNRPFVRDGRLQAKKKRTDRSYLRSSAAPAPQPVEEELEVTEEESAEAPEPMPVAAAVAEPAHTRAEPRPVQRVPAAVRAIQQQGVRKRGEIDLHELAVADTRYALHELRRIAILATLVIITIIVLAIVLR